MDRSTANALRPAIDQIGSVLDEVHSEFPLAMTSHHLADSALMILPDMKRQHSSRPLSVPTCLCKHDADIHHDLENARPPDQFRGHRMK